MRPPLVLGIESSCDDTACALLDGTGAVLASVVSSQPEVHRPWGGVVPELASRQHLANWPTVSGAVLAQVGVSLGDVDLVAATRGPGLLGSLLVGLSLGRTIAWALERPFFAVHHLEGHLYSPFLAEDPGPAEPIPDRFVGLVVSGGHTSLYAAAADGSVEGLAETRDDAMGEVFDKVGKRIGLSYPQGPVVDRLAEEGDPTRDVLTVPRLADSLDFSFSGLKSQTQRIIERLEDEGVRPAEGSLEVPTRLKDLLASFRAAAVSQIVDRLDQLVERQPIPLLAVSGGVAANRLLRRRLTEWAATRSIPLRLVPLRYAGDNAAMIAFAALLRHRWGRHDDPLTTDAVSRLPVG